MAYDWNLASAWGANKLRVRNKRDGQSGDLTGYGREQWHQAMAHPVHGWNPPAGDTPYFFTHRMQKLVSLFPILTSDRILIVGVGLGYLAEAFKNAGFTACWGVEDSTYIQGRIDAETRADIVVMKKDLKGGNTIPNLQAEFSSKTGASTFDWIITEDWLMRYADAQIGVFASAAPTFLTGGKPLSNILHLVIPTHVPGLDQEGNPVMIALDQDPNYYHRSLSGYQALLAGHTIVSTYGDWEVYGG